MGKGLIRGSKALNVINRFERVASVLYVEGPGDRIFWKTLLDFYEINDVSINIAGSCTAIDTYIERIVSDNVKIFVARDKDYKFLLHRIPSHNRILLTYGHSIENTLIDNQSLTEIVTINGGDRENISGEIVRWEEELSAAVQELIIRELANEISQSGVSVFGDHYEFICGKKGNDGFLPIDKIHQHINTLDKKLPPEAVQEARGIFEAFLAQSFWYIRGHFLFSIALKFIKTLISQFTSKGKEPNLSNDAMNMLLTQQLKTNFASGVHPHQEFYTHQVERMKAELAA